MYATTASEIDRDKESLELQIIEAREKAINASRILASKKNWGADHLIAYNLYLNHQINTYEELRKKYVNLYITKPGT